MCGKSARYFRVIMTEDGYVPRRLEPKCSLSARMASEFVKSLIH